MPGGVVPEYSTGILCIYPGSNVRWESPGVYFLVLSISRGPYVRWKVPEYKSGFLYIPGLMLVGRVPEYVYILGPMSGGKVQEYSTWSYVRCKFQEYSTGVLYIYIYDPMSVGKVSDNSTGFLCIYPGPCVSLEGPRI